MNQCTGHYLENKNCCKHTHTQEISLCEEGASQMKHNISDTRTSKNKAGSAAQTRSLCNIVRRRQCDNDAAGAELGRVILSSQLPL